MTKTLLLAIEFIRFSLYSQKNDFYIGGGYEESLNERNFHEYR